MHKLESLSLYAIIRFYVELVYNRDTNKIVVVNSSKSGLNQAKETYKDTNQYFRYDTIIFKENMKLTDLTGNLETEKLLREMHRLE